jgi:outer membrane protein TolC
MNNTLRTGLLVGTFSLASISVSAAEMSMSDAVELALQRDSGVIEFEQRSNAAAEHGLAGERLPAPRLKVGANNVPVDSFDFDQEAMTMFSVGISQMFPSGDTRALQKSIGEIGSQSMSYRANDRRHKVVMATRQNWFQIYYWQKALDIYQEDRELFDQLLVITRSQFSVGKNQQQDVLRAELEISRLDERVLTAENTFIEARAGLARWIGEEGLMIRVPNELEVLPEITLNTGELNSLAQSLAAHPMMRSYSLEVERTQKLTELAEEDYKPAWNVDMSYAFRGGQDPDHSDRSDFLSVMVNVSLPALNRKRQDRLVAEKRALTASEQAHYITVLRDHTLKFQTLRAQWQQMHQRRNLFETSLLRQSRAQATAALNAYQSDATDFAEVMRAFLGDQQMQLDYEYLRVREQSLLAELHYLTATDSIDTGLVQ